MADTRTETFDNVFVGKATGTLKLNASGLAWKASSSAGKTITHRREEIRSLSSARSVRGFQVRIILPNGASLKLDGFSKEGLDLLRKYIKDAYDKEIEKREFNLKGIHWGDLEVKDSVLMFGSGSKPTMEIPLSEIENAILSSKNDISIELTVDTEVANDDVIVTEMQFHIDDVKRKNRDDEEDQTEEATAAEALHKRIKASTGRGLETQTPVASFEDLNCSHPSGRFKIDLFEKLFWIHSAANDYKLLYSNIQRIFLLPKDEDKSYVVIALNTSIRQGQTLYQYLIFNFENTDELKISISLSEQDIATKYSGKLRKEYDGAAFQVVTEILSGISGKTVTTPGDQPFRNNYAQNFVQCSVKTNRGSLYPLRKAFFFVGKIPHYIGYSTVKKVEFTGLELNSTIFDMRVTIRADESDDTTLVFSQLNRSTLKELEEFLQSRDIRVKKVTPVAAPVKKMELDDGGDEDEDEDSPDEDFAPAEDSDIEEEYDEGSGAENAPSSEPKKDKDKGKEKEKAVEKEKSKEKPKTHEKDSGKDKKRSRDEDEEEEQEEEEEEEEDEDDDEDKAKQSKSKKKASKHDAEDEEEEEDEDEDEEEEKPKKKDKEKEKEKDKKKDSHKDKDKKKEKESSSSSSKSSKKSKDDDKPKKRAKKDKDAPKRALTGFIIFSTEKRKTLKGKTIGEQGKELGEMWKKISPEEKKEWEEKSKKDKERYEREMKAYKEKKKNEE